MPQYSEFAELLKRSKKHCNELNEYLRLEREQIETGALAELSSTLNFKADLLSVLESNHNHLRMWLSNNGFGLSIEEFSVQANLLNQSDSNPLKESQAYIEQCTELWTELEQLKNECAQSNKVNGIVITQSKKRARERLDILKGISSAEKLYGANGLQTSASAGRKSQRA